MVKKKGPVWEHWTEIRNRGINNNKPNSHPSVQCNYCSKNFERAVPKRMQAHLDENCTEAPNNAKSQSSHESAIPSNEESSPNTSIRANTFEINRPTKRIKTSGIDNLNDRVSEVEQQTLNLSLAEALHSAGVPLSFVDNPLVIRFFQYLRPSFKLSNRRELEEAIRVQCEENDNIESRFTVSKPSYHDLDMIERAKVYRILCEKCNEEFNYYYCNGTDEMKGGHAKLGECIQTNTEYYQRICLYESGNKVVDNFIRYTQIKSDLNFNMMMEFIPYDQFKDIKFIAEVELSKIFKATWIDGPILSWDNKKLNFERSGPRAIALKQLNNSENITSKELNEVQIYLITIQRNLSIESKCTSFLNARLYLSVI